MSLESGSRKDLGLLLRSYREKLKWSRIVLAERVSVKVRVIINLEHGVKNPSRHEFLAIINILPLSSKDREKAFRMLRVIHPRRRQKVNLQLKALRHRNRFRLYG